MKKLTHILWGTLTTVLFSSFVWAATLPETTPAPPKPPQVPPPMARGISAEGAKDAP